MPLDSVTKCETDENLESDAVSKSPLQKHYLVKWRALSYEESTWELETHIDPDKIKQFEARKIYTPDNVIQF